MLHYLFQESMWLFSVTLELIMIMTVSFFQNVMSSLQNMLENVDSPGIQQCYQSPKFMILRHNPACSTKAMREL